MVTYQILFVIILGLTTCEAKAADGDPLLIHPDQIYQCLKASAASGLVVNASHNPYYLRGDFDGDGRPDYAVAVRGARTKRNGVLFCMANKSTHVVGADQPFKPPFSAMPDDNFVAPNWEVFSKTDVEDLRRYRVSVPHPVPKTAGEAVAMIWEDGIALVYWDGRRFRWAGSKN